MSYPTFSAIVLAGGKGHRLDNVTGGKQKVLHTVNGQALIEYSLRLLDHPSITRIIVNVGHRSDDVKDWFNGRTHLCPVFFSHQREPTIIDAIETAMPLIETDHIICCNGDEIRRGINIADVLHYYTSAPTSNVLLGVHKTQLHRYRRLYPNQKGVLLHTELKNQIYRDQPEEQGIVNAGMMLFQKRYFHLVERTYGDGWEGIISPLCRERLLSVYVAPGAQYFNVGTPDELQEAREQLR